MQRPDATLYRRTAQNVPSSDDDDSGSDSDSDSPSMAKKRKPMVNRMETEAMMTDMASSRQDPRAVWPAATSTQMNGTNFEQRFKKKNNIWANVLGEQQLSDVIGGVGLKTLRGDRSVENYDYKAAQAIMGSNPPSENEEGEISDNAEVNVESEQEPEENMIDIKKRLGRKRPLSERLGPQKKPKERNLIEIEDISDMSDEEFGNHVAEALYESKPDIIIKVINVVGRKAALEIYNETREKEREGGMMVLNGMRRRTSGGVYIQLLKQRKDITPEQIDQIFPPNEKKEFWDRRKRVGRKRIRHDSKPQGKSLIIFLEIINL